MNAGASVNAMWTAVVRRRGLPLWVDGTIALALLVGMAIWGTAYWHRTAGRGQPYYYQPYFEPAVMIACGKGFVVARPQVPAMVAFLLQRVDHFSCDAIAPGTRFSRDDVFQLGSWRYLMLTVGYTWRFLGVSWAGVGPLLGTFYGAAIAAAYLLFRLGMSAILALPASMAFALATLHLKYLGHLRDYAKAPFALALFALLGLFVVGRATWARVLTLAAASGALLGVAYGFRTDFEAYIPPFLLTIALFLEGGPARHLSMKAAAGALFVATFLVAAWPVISTLDEARSGCGWHVILLGLSDRFYAPLGVTPAPYEASRENLDEWTYTTVTSYMGRVNPGVGHVGLCDTTYSAGSGAYLREVVRRFPADAIVRGFASIRRVVELPFSPVPGVDDEGDRAVDWGAGHGVGMALVIATIALTMAVDVRVGVFLLFFLVYFGALPVLQFDHRHFFHLIFITWWATGFLVQSAITDRGRWTAARSGLRGAAVVLIGCAAAFLLVLWSARAYQQPEVRAMLSAYLGAPRDPIPLSQVLSADPRIRVSPHTDPETADFVAVDLDEARCGEHTTVAFRYGDPARRAYERSFAVRREPAKEGLTHIFMPVYDGFSRLDFVDAPTGCVDGVYRVRQPQQFPLLLEAVLTPDWKHEPMYQRLD
jgi:hypothetical protein